MPRQDTSTDAVTSRGMIRYRLLGIRSVVFSFVASYPISASSRHLRDLLPQMTVGCTVNYEAAASTIGPRQGPRGVIATISGRALCSDEREISDNKRFALHQQLHRRAGPVQSYRFGY
jgi:hypothetical protein